MKKIKLEGFCLYHPEWKAIAGYDEGQIFGAFCKDDSIDQLRNIEVWSIFNLALEDMQNQNPKLEKKKITITIQLEDI